MSRILITGCSSGFGFDTAQYFLDRGWEVVATMRNPESSQLTTSDRLRVLGLDVTSQTSIDHAVAEAGNMDVLVNNAGVGMLKATEISSMNNIRELFETNVLGTIAVTKALLPSFIQRRAGVIVNVSSSVTLKPLPLLASYSATKAAVNAFSNSLALEVEPFGIRVRVVLPGAAPKTNFGQNARARMGSEMPEAYARVADAMFESFRRANLFTESDDVTTAIWEAATNPGSAQLIPAGADATALFKRAVTTKTVEQAQAAPHHGGSRVLSVHDSLGADLSKAVI